MIGMNQPTLPPSVTDGADFQAVVALLGVIKDEKAAGDRLAAIAAEMDKGKKAARGNSAAPSNAAAGNGRQQERNRAGAHRGIR